MVITGGTISFTNPTNLFGYGGDGSPLSPAIPAWATIGIIDGTSLVIPSVSPYDGAPITSIGDSAFSSRSGLTSVTIPNSVTSIGNGAFSSCRGLSKVIVDAINSPTLGSYVFNNTNDCPIYVPTPDTYRVATNWAVYANRIFPLVAAVEGLANIDTTTYTKACVIGADESYKEYTYDGSQWNEVV